MEIDPLIWVNSKPWESRCSGHVWRRYPMNDLIQITATRLRQRADHCREMARHAVSAGIAGVLESIATDYDRDAMLLESNAPPQSRN